jgi:membrane glycosyltransferase
VELHTHPELRTAEADPLERYLDRLAPNPDTRRWLAARAGTDDVQTPERALARLHRSLAGEEKAGSSPGDTVYRSIAGRLRVALGMTGDRPDAPSPSVADAQAANDACRDSDSVDAARSEPLQHLPVAPPPHRTPMAPHPWGPLNPIVRWKRSSQRVQGDAEEERRPSDGGPRNPWPAPRSAPRSSSDEDDVVDAPDPQGRWQHNGNIRRLILLALMLGQTALATWFMRRVMPYQGTEPLEMAMLALFAVLFCWISAGFWTAMAGFLVLLRGSDRYIIARDAEHRADIDRAAHTAIVMPICNEDVSRVAAGLRATYESVVRSGEIDRFDFYILSDSNDPDICAAEVAAWAELCRSVNGFGRIFLRRRHRRVKRKSGNIDDFCRRWGGKYRYMIVLDADSVMSGTCLTTLVQMMESNPGAGIIQTAPRAAGRETLYARIQQFSTRVYGPLFTAGLHYWQLGESHYWGHNAIIRVAPFIRHCALAPLPGRGSLAGEILSHDFVEAALMRRAGWAVWIAYDLDGSYEEMPPNLLDEMKRERRWCHGNLMNFRLFGARGMHPVHRAVFVTGVMAYLSAPLWLIFLALSMTMFSIHTLTDPQYFVEPRQLFPIWPQWHPEKAIALFSATATLLFLPKFLSVLLIWMQGAREFGGSLRLLASMIIELLVSMLLAPVRMLFHTRFVAAAFLGWALNWKSPPREDNETNWTEATRKHGFQTVLGILWGTAVFILDRSFLPWVLPIAGALALSIPISVLSSRVSLGRLFRRAKLFLIPEEVHPPIELQETFAHLQSAKPLPGFVDAVVDPVVNALACAAQKPRTGLPGPARERGASLVHSALVSGPGGLEDMQKLALLRDPLLLSQLHFDVWTSADAHPEWGAFASTRRRLKSAA